MAPSLQLSCGCHSIKGSGPESGERDRECEGRGKGISCQIGFEDERNLKN